MKMYYRPVREVYAAMLVSSILGLICAFGVSHCGAANQDAYDVDHGFGHGNALSGCEQESRAAATDAGWFEEGGQSKGRAAAIAANYACLARMQEAGK